MNINEICDNSCILCCNLRYIYYIQICRWSICWGWSISWRKWLLEVCQGYWDINFYNGRLLTFFLTWYSFLSKKQKLIIYSCYVGAYAPVTKDGNIVVDGVLASCYVFYDHNLAHIGMTPMRWFPDIINWIFGGNNESPDYVNMLETLGRLMLIY